MLIKLINSKLTQVQEYIKVNITLNWEIWKVFLLKALTRKRCPLKPFLFNRVLKVYPEKAGRRERHAQES